MKKILLLLLSFAFEAGAHSPNYKKAQISGKISGEISSIESISFSYYPSKIIFAMDGIKKFEVMPEKDGTFNFEISNIDKLCPIFQIGIKYNKKKPEDVRGPTDAIWDYQIEPGDSINLNIEVSKYNITKLVFSGRGSAKYQCRRAIENIFNQEYKSNVSKLAEKLSLKFLDPENLTPIYEAYKKSKIIMLDTLCNYKDEISEESYNILHAELLGWLDQQIDLQINIFWNRNDSLARLKVKDFYFKNIIDIPKFSERTTALSIAYVAAIYQRLETRLLLNSKVSDGQFLNPADIFEQITANNKGELRDRLLTNMIIDGRKQLPLLYYGNSSAKHITDAYKLISDIDLKNKVKNSKLARSFLGGDAYKFRLSDTANRIVHLEDFKGKILLMDLWFWGCSGCAIFSNRFEKEIYPQVKDNKEFEVVSIGTDFDSAIWRKGIASGKYSHESYMNLHLPIKNSNFFKEPMIKFYSLTGLPFILLINRDGKIIRELSEQDSSEKIVRLILEAIQDK